MMIKYIIILLITLSSSADLFLGIGTNIMIPGPDENKSNTFVPSIKWEHGYFSVNFNCRDTYKVYKVDIDSHCILGIGGKIIDFDITDNLNFYFDLGGAYTTKKSIALSSSLLFQQIIGLRYDNLGISINHTSNAGLVGSNEGETMFSIDYLWKF